MRLIGILDDFSDEVIIYYDKSDNKYYNERKEPISNETMTEFAKYLNNAWEKTACINLHIKHEEGQALAIKSIICYDNITAFLYGYGNNPNEAKENLEFTFNEINRQFIK